MTLTNQPTSHLSGFSELALNICRCLSIFIAIIVPMSTGAATIAGSALLFFWLLSGQAPQTLKCAWRQPFGKMLVFFALWLIIGMFYADTDWNTRLTTLSSWKKLLFVYILMGMFDRLEWQKRFVQFYVLAMLIAAMLALALWSLDWNVRPSNNSGAGIFMTNHATQSMAFVAALLCCIFLLHNTQNRRKKYYLLGAVALFLFNIFFVSIARSGYLAIPFAAVFAVGSIYGFRKLPQITAVALIALSIFALTSNTLQKRVNLALDEQANYQTSSALTSIGIRIIFYQNTLELIRQKPWFGYGTSSFENAYTTLSASKSQDWRGSGTTDPHNQYLFIWTENGLIGVLLFLAYIYFGIRQGLNNKPYGPIAASFLVAIAASSLFNSHFKTFAEGYLLAFFLGALLTPNQPLPSRKQIHP